ncbi:Gamma-crystallin M2 [Anabarilius grahami]|uniref:Gamma-crystallin M2 n=1 Tax=Anabarilius grahami TaxID=495550 RepID=A0A3N0Z7T7_ANAGA|nr:Gamma-crystallin M2 [Anabarilius grahami]
MDRKPVSCSMQQGTEYDELVELKTRATAQLSLGWSGLKRKTTDSGLDERYLSSHMCIAPVTFYEDRNFQGRSYDCMGDSGDFSSYMSRCHSCRVESGCWMMYDHPNYMGNGYFFRRGEYADYMSMFGMNNCIRSCRMIPMHRGSYRMRIYERENFMGQMHEMMDDCDNTMDRYRMSHCHSCHVMDGHWLMYEQPHYRGRMWYFRPGEYKSFSNMGGMRFMSMRRIMDSWY